MKVYRVNLTEYEVMDLEDSSKEDNNFEIF